MQSKDKKHNNSFNPIQFIEYSESLYLGYFLANLEIDMVTTLEKGESNLSLFKEDAMVTEMIGDFKTLLINPRIIFDLHQNERLLAKLNRYRQEIEKRVRILASYADQSKIIEYVLNRREMDFIEGEKVFETDESVAGKVLGFLFQDEDSVIINDKIKLIYSQLPIRMTKSYFYQYVQTSLGRLVGVDQENFDRYVTSLEEVFDPSSTAGYGEFYQEIHEDFKRLNKLTSSDLDLNGFKELMELHRSIVENIEETIDILLMMVQLINELLGTVLMINEKSLQNNKDRVEHFVELSHHLSVNEVDLDEDDRLVELLSGMEGVIEKLTDELSLIEVQTESAIKTRQEELIQYEIYDRYEKVMRLSVLTSGSFFGQLSRGEENEGNEVVDYAYLGNAQKKLENFMQDRISRDDKRIQRARMAMTFSVLNVIHKSPQEVYEFILESLKACKNSGEKEASKRLMLLVMETYM